MLPKSHRGVPSRCSAADIEPNGLRDEAQSLPSELTVTHAPMVMSASRIVGRRKSVAKDRQEPEPTGPDRDDLGADTAAGIALDDFDVVVQEPPTRAMPRDAGDLAVVLLLDEARSQHPGVLEAMSREPLAIIIQVPDASYVVPLKRWVGWRGSSAWSQAANMSAKGDIQSAPDGYVLIAHDGIGKAQNRDENNNKVTEALASGRAVVGISPNPERYLPSALIEAADHRFTVPRPTAKVVDQIIASIIQRKVRCQLPDDTCALLGIDDLRMSVRPGSTKRDCLLRLGKAAARRLTRARELGPRLEDLHGMDEARVWGLAVSEDLRLYRAGTISWSEVDRGALLAGPPGTEKTTFARALATSCGCPFVSGSLAAWQATGHLGDLLGAMRRTFDEALKAAPCILLVDEVDSFGDRAAFKSDHRDYSVQVVNGFLEELDGAQGREGVVVIGACNDPNRLDPAIRRSGRLDRIISIDLPDVDALRKIFRHHLGSDMLVDADLTPAALVALGGTGADVERWVRGARRRARAARRAMVLDDLMDEIRDGVPPLLGDDLWRAAVHEAGHATAVLLLGGSVERVSVFGNAAEGGQTLSWLIRTPMPTWALLRRRLVVLLAGRAAEEIVLGAPSTAAGGDIRSDLAQATTLAVRIEAADGLGSALLWAPPPIDGDITELLAQYPELRDRVSNLLDHALAEARALLSLNQKALRRVAMMLMERKHLDADDLGRILAENRADGGPPWVPR